MSEMDIDNMDFELPKAPNQVAESILLYPVYIDKSKSLLQGRKIPAGKAVVEPSSIFMFEACRALGYQAFFEGEKRHPRDQLVFGRVRVVIKRNNMPIIPSIPTKKQLLCKIASMHDSIAEQLTQQDPKLKAMAAGSRSEISQVVKELAQVSIQDNKKKSKKKK